jgi:hypothetical protein
MTLLFDEDLVEAVTFLWAGVRRPGVSTLEVRRFQSERERAYSVPDPDARNAAFARVHLAWFRQWGLEQQLTGVVARFPRLDPALAALGFRTARTRSEEGAELYVNAEGTRHGIVALRPGRFEDAVWLARLIHHELMHLSDMVDPAFGYSPEINRPGWTASHLRLIRERYRLLWDVTIDGRLTAAGWPAAATRDQRRVEFERAHTFLSSEKRRHAFETLWNADSPRHEQLLALAENPRELTGALQPSPGAPCPLCGFSTFDWSDVLSLGPEVIGGIQRDFPAWNSDQGACSRCAEVYSAAAHMARSP